MPSYRIGQVAELLGVSVDTVRRWADAGRLGTTRSEGGQRVVDGAPAAARRAGWESQAATAASRTRARRTGPVRERTMLSLLQHPVGPASGTRPVWHALRECAGSTGDRPPARPAVCQGAELGADTRE